VFVRPSWRPTSPQDAFDLMEQNPWALLVSNSDEGPLATNLPLLFDGIKPAKQEDSFMLVGHIARANHHLRSLALTKTPVLAIFQGPWSYVTASWYPNRDMPSTYYYTAVHCYGLIEFQQEEQLDKSLEQLIQQMESDYPNGWKSDEIPRSEITRRFAAIAGFRIRVTRMEAKFKLGQDEPLRDALAVAEVLGHHQGQQDQALAALIRKHNQARST